MTFFREIVRSGAVCAALICAVPSRQVKAQATPGTSGLVEYPALINGISIRKAHDKLWAACYGNGLWKMADGQWAKVEGLPSKWLTSMAVDQHQNLALGSWFGDGMIRFDTQSMTSKLVSWPPSQLGISKVYDLCSSPKGVVVSSQFGLSLLDRNDKWALMPELDEDGERVATNGEDVWVLSIDQLTRFSRGETPVIYTKGFGALGVSAIEFYQGRIFLGTFAGQLLEFDRSAQTLRLLAKAPAGISSPLLKIVATDKRMYLAYGEQATTAQPEGDTGGLGAYDWRTSKVVLLPHLPSHNWKDLLVEGDTLWAIGKQGGVSLPLSNFDAPQAGG